MCNGSIKVERQKRQYLKNAQTSQVSGFYVDVRVALYCGYPEYISGTVTRLCIQLYGAHTAMGDIIRSLWILDSIFNDHFLVQIKITLVLLSAFP